MRLPALVLPVLSLLLLVQTLGAQEPDLATEYATRAAELTDWQEKELRAIRKACVTKKNFSLVRRLQVELKRIGCAVEEDEVSGADTPKLSAKARAALEAKYDRYRVRAGAKLASLAKWCAAEGLVEESRRHATEALLRDRENATAHKVLGREKISGWGFVPVGDAAKMKKGLLPFEDRWIDKATVIQRRREWKHAWVVESEIWSIRSNLELRRIFELRDLLDAFYERFMADWEGFLPMRPRMKKFEVLIFARQAQYTSFLETTDPRHTKGVPGQYSPNLKRSAFFDVETLRTGSNAVSSLTELMLHECTHHLMDEAVASKFVNFDPGTSPNFWLHEGIGEYYGMHTLVKGRLAIDRKAAGKMLRTTFVKQRAARMLSLEELDAIEKNAFLSTDMSARQLNYAQSGFLILFLLKKHAGAMKELLRAAYTKANRKGMIAEFVGGDLGSLNAKFAAWVRRF